MLNDIPITKILLYLLFMVTLLNTGDVNGCIPPSAEIFCFHGLEGEDVVQLYMDTAGYWSCTLQDAGSGADMSGYFKTIVVNDRQPLVWVIRVVRGLPSENGPSLRVLLITCHCTVDGTSKVFHRKAMLQDKRTDNVQNIHSLLHFSVSKCAKKKSVLKELYKDFRAGDTELVFKVMRDGAVNEEELSKFAVTRNGVITLSGSLEKDEGQTFLLILKLIKPDETSQVVPVAIYVSDELQHTNSDNQIASSAEPTLTAPRFFNRKCHPPQSCYVKIFRSEIPRHHKGKITNLSPCDIQVEEVYSGTVSFWFVAGNPSIYQDMFTINSTTGEIFMSNMGLVSDTQSFFIIVQTRSDNPAFQHYDSALVYIRVMGEDRAVKTDLTPATQKDGQISTESSMPTKTDTLLLTTNEVTLSIKVNIKSTPRNVRIPTQKTTSGPRRRKRKTTPPDTTEDRSLVELMSDEMAVFKQMPGSTFSSTEAERTSGRIRWNDVDPQQLNFVNSCVPLRNSSLWNMLKITWLMVVIRLENSIIYM